MALGTGSSLGSYQIVSLLGKGGMGEVYRARDTRLGRDVAIKLILQAFEADRERIARLEREAKALAALNHPSIATLHGLETVEGRHFLVMELVEGETLAERLNRGAVALDETLAIARQIAEALEAAHEKGVIHRDLKPANVKISDDDRVKLLDFGLAKAVEPPTASASSTFANSPTISAHGTQAGVILGTASYMSPEQARGLPTDHRSDVFAFGVVLYEMLAGEPPFQGDTVSDVLASVLAREPNFSALSPDLNPRLITLVRRCLEKSPRRRWQAIGDVRLELEDIAARPQAPAVSVVPAPAPPTFWQRFAPAVLAALGAAALVALVAWRLWPHAVSGPVTRFAITLNPTHRIQGIGGQVLAVSPDGSTFAYVANRQVFVRAASGLSARRVYDNPGLSVVGAIAFSPDGQQLAFWTQGDATLKRLAIAGGAPAAVCTIPTAPAGLSWADDSILFADPQGILRVPVAGGTPEVVIKAGNGETFSGPELLPGGRVVLYTAATGTSLDRWDHARIVAQPLDGGARTVLLEGGTEARYVPTGYLTYANAGILFAMRFDASRLRSSGAPVPVLEGVRRGTGPLGAGVAHYVFSSTGTLVYLPGPTVAGVSPQLYLALFDEAGTAEPLKMQAGPYSQPRLSPNGQLAAYGVDDGRDVSIWVIGVAGGQSPRRLTFGGKDQYPVWSSDSSHVIFQSDRGGDLGLYSQPADGAGVATRLTTAPAGVEHIAQTASPDGKVLLFDAIAKDKTTLMEYRFADKSMAPYGGITSLTTTGAAFSPDGKWVAYSLQTTSGVMTNVTFVQPYPATGALFQISKNEEDGHHQVWSSDGSRLFYTPGPGAVLLSVQINKGAGLTLGETKQVTRTFTNAPPTSQRPFDTAPKTGKILALTGTIRTDSAAPLSELYVVVNWFEELRQKVK